MTPAERARHALARVDACLTQTGEVLDTPSPLRPEIHARMIEAVLAKTLLDLAAHIERIAVIVALEIDGHVPPRSEDGGRGLFDLVTRPTRLRPALLRNTADLRAIIRERHGERFAGRRGASPDLREQLRRIETRAIPSLRAGLDAIGPLLERDGRPASGTPRAVAARALHEARLAELGHLAEEVRDLARRHGREIRLFGSFVRGRVHQESDLDVLILGDPPAGRWSDPFVGDIEDLGQRRGISVDVLFSDDAPHLEEEAIP